MDDFDDIPVALRDTPVLQPKTFQRRIFWIAGLSAAAVGLAAGALVAVLPGLRQTVASEAALEGGLGVSSGISSGGAIAPLARPVSQEIAEDGGVTTSPEGDAATLENDNNPKVVATQAQGSAASGAAQNSILGHYAYEEVSQERLKEVAPGIQLTDAAADSYRAMAAAAQADGVRLVPLSGFRSKADQQYLFFGVKGERGQTAAERAKVSAPPGHSEHHTGYAIDIGDASSAGANLSESFEQTEAFQWLKDNAAYHSFELSFPKGNPQGVNYEPWHWRFVGNQESLEIFHTDAKPEG